MRRSLASLILALGLLLAPGIVHANFVLLLVDDTDVTTVADNGLSDASPIEGRIHYTGIHAGIALTGVVALSRDEVGSVSNPELVLGVPSAIRTAGGSGRLGILITDNDFDASSPTGQADISGGTNGSIFVRFFGDTGNRPVFQGFEFAAFGPLTTSPFSETESVDGDDIGSLTIDADLVLSSPGQTGSFDASITLVPEPGATALGAAALASTCILALGRRRCVRTPPTRRS